MDAKPDLHITVTPNTYEIRRRAAKQGLFMCPVCGRVSAHPKDLEEGYCGRCHTWTGDA
jgi:ribosomal protein S27AE